MSSITHIISIRTRDAYNDTNIQPINITAKSLLLLAKYFRLYLVEHREEDDYMEDDEWDKYVDKLVKGVKKGDIEIAPELNAAYIMSYDKVITYEDKVEQIRLLFRDPEKNKKSILTLLLIMSGKELSYPYYYSVVNKVHWLNEETNKLIKKYVEKFCEIIQKTPINIKELEKILKKMPSREVDYAYYFSLFCAKYIKGNVKEAQTVVKTIEDLFYKPFKGTVTYTFGEVAESHVGMEQIGVEAERGFNIEELRKAQKYFERRGCKTELIHLNEFLPTNIDDDKKIEQKHLNIAKKAADFQAYVLVARNGVKCLTGDDKGKELLTEALLYKWDAKMASHGTVKNKNARSNLNYSDKQSMDNFQEMMDRTAAGESLKELRDAGTVLKGNTISWENVPILSNLRSKLKDAFGPEAEGLKCEGNNYHTLGKTPKGIGYHCDLERKKVIGVRLGKEMNMHWGWWYYNQPRGYNISITLKSGDIYCMSEKTVGTDGSKKLRYIIKHAAGAPKYTTNMKNLKIKNIRQYGENENIRIGDPWHKGELRTYK